MYVQTAFLLHMLLLFYADNVMYEFILVYELTRKVLGDFLKKQSLEWCP